MQSRVRGTIEAVAIKNLQELLRKKGITAEALFTKYDIDGDGSIDQSEFKAALESITGQQAPDAILSTIFGAVDANNDGTLNLEEILALLDGGPAEAVSEGSSVEIRDHPNDHYNGVYEAQSSKINGKTWYMNPANARLYFYNANSGGAPSWSLDDREQDGSNDWYRGGWARPKSDESLPTGLRRWVGVGKISVTPSSPQAIDSDPEITTLDEYSSDSDRNFVFAPEELTWNEHNHRATEMGGHLASITNAEENEQVARIAGGRSVWVGGVRKGRGNGPGADHWYWSDGRPWTYTNWASGEPNNHGSGENRMQLYGHHSGLWNDVGEGWRGTAVYEMPVTASAPTTTPAPNIEISEASPGQPIRFRINNRPSGNDAWVGVYRKGTRNEDHGENWRWLRDIDPENATLPAQPEGEYSVRLFSDGGYSMLTEEQVTITSDSNLLFDNFSDDIQSTIASLEADVMEGKITVEQAREIADSEVEKQIGNLPFMLKSSARSLWRANADRMQIELTSQLAEKGGTIAAGAAIAGAAAGVAAATKMQDSDTASVQDSFQEENEYSSHDDWHEEYQVDVPDRVEVETEIEVPDQVEVETEVEIPEYEDPDDWYATTKVNVGTRVSVPDRVTVGSRRSLSFTTSPTRSEAVSPVPTIAQETDDSSSELSSMSAIAAAFTEARMLSDQRKLAVSVEGKTFEFEIKVTSDPERTFGIGIENSYRGGMTIIGDVAEVGEVEVRLPSGADSESLSKGRISTISTSFSGWNGIRKRLIVNAQ
ncbi:MAG: EF-hand domain-containing protein [Candidatus Thalassarchaeum sp.]